MSTPDQASQEAAAESPQDHPDRPPGPDIHCCSSSYGEDEETPRRAS